jgi:formamidopyrimidine-DNA glycosylase
MPELPEVETVRRGLEARVLGRSITAVEVRHPQVIVGSVEEFERNTRGCIRRLDRKGKAIAIELDSSCKPAVGDRGGNSSRYLMLRLGMTGQVTVLPSDHPLEPHTHVRLTLDNGEEIRYRDMRRFGRLRSCSQAEIEAIFKGLAPDALTMPEAEFILALKGRRTPIKSWLLNQTRVAGVGNIYADEALFEARIHPLAEAGRLKRSGAVGLHRAVEKVLRRAVAKQGTSFRDYVDIEGRQGRFAQSLKVYQRTGQPCRRCGTRIQRLVLSGRSSHFCPRCQPRPRRRLSGIGGK